MIQITRKYRKEIEGIIDKIEEEVQKQENIELKSLFRNLKELK